MLLAAAGPRGVLAAHTCSMTLPHGSSGELYTCWGSMQAQHDSRQRKQLVASNAHMPQQLTTKPDHKFDKPDRTVLEVVHMLGVSGYRLC